MTELPLGWVWTTIADCCAVTLGQSPPGSSYNEAGVGTPFFQGKAEFGDLFPTIRKWTTQPTKTAVENDVLISVRAPVGPTNLAPCDCAIGRGLGSLRPLGGIHSRYVLYWFRASERELASRGTGTTFGAISGAVLRQHSIPVAPLAEQRRIVATIEEHLSRLDAACGSLTRVQRLLERWRSATLAVIARHPAPERRIGDVARVGSGATPKRDRPEYWTGGDVPWVTSGQLTRPFVIEPAALITQKALRETSCRVWPKGTLLVALYGEGKTRGHCSELVIDAATNQACAAIQIHDPDVDRAFLKLYFNATYQANRSLSAGGVQPNLSLGLIKDMTFPCPPVTEQRAIVARIEAELTQADHLGLAVAEALAESAGLRRSVLARAFRGELVPQDPNDEPANLLLDRIAATRAARLAPGRKQRVRTPA